MELYSVAKIYSLREYFARARAKLEEKDLASSSTYQQKAN